MADIKTTIAQLIEGEVYSDEKTLDEYSRDASLFQLRPQLVVSPTNVKDISALVNFANLNCQRGISLTARSGGTDMTGGPLTESICLDMTAHFDKIIAVSSDCAITQPGVFFRDFDKATKKLHREMPSYPASRELCTVGGMVANNSGGEKTLAYGKTENYVMELRMVMADGQEHIFAPLTTGELHAKMQQTNFEGQVYRQLYQLIDVNYDLIKQAKPQVTKNSAGYYLWNVWDKQKGIFDPIKLLVGSQGTLGIITQVTFRLVEPQKHSQMLVLFLKNLDSLADIVKRVMAYKPESFESYDDHTLKLAIRFMPDIAKRMRGKNLLQLLWQFVPEAKMVLTAGMPKLVLLAEFTGPSLKDVHARAQAARSDLQDLHLQTYLTRKKADEEKYWLVRRESFNLLRHHIKGKHTAPFIDDVVVRHDQLPQFLPELNAIMRQYNLIYTIAGHIGDANFHIIPLMDLADPKTKEIIPQLSKQVYDLVLRYKGSISGEHNDGLIRTPFLPQMYGPKIVQLFSATKKIFDPHNIFNPGKKVGGNFAYSMSRFVAEESAKKAKNEVVAKNEAVTQLGRASLAKNG